MEKKQVIQSYFRGLEKGSYEEVVRLFAPDALVHSPLYGKVKASLFYKELFSDTQSSKIVLKNTFLSAEKPDSAAAHFVYSWTMKDGNHVQFECIDVFEFVPGSDKIKLLTIIYDTYGVRQGFEKNHS
jgi:ketosteroid isomerase-like protein